MKKVRFIFIITLLNFAGTAISQQHFPGGVPGAEAWYIAKEGDNESLHHPNHGTPHINIATCEEKIGEPYLFNFNPSFLAEKLCLMYKAPLENTNSRNVFFVGEPESNENMSHLTTAWNADLDPMPAPTVRNWFHISNDEALAEKQHSAYQSVNNANVNFYSWNLYQTDRRFKSYGMDGETNLYIGRDFQNDTIDAKSFSGNFPEFISFPFELTANQRNRVDSYLALKYGISLFQKESYRNSKNIVFWKTANNQLFRSRIFGIGRDDTSGLNQLISESVHQKDFLVASAGEWAENNTIKQEKYTIDNLNFIVFGDNGLKPGFDQEYQGKIKKIRRVWLSQNTGEASSRYGIFFKLNLEGDLQNYLIANPHLKIWMMRDRFVNNQQQSGFQGQGIDYYPAYEMINYTNYALFRDIFFDTDNNTHDQFTFGIGPEMIIQLELDSKACDDPRIYGKVVISGGTAPYDLTIINSNGYYQNIVVQENFYLFEPEPNVSYGITVVDSNGVQCQGEFTTNQPQITVDLGPDQVLTTSLPQIILDASAGVLDPGATYSWFKDGIALGQYGPTLTVNEPGYYYIIITSGNGMCQMSDAIYISYNFKGAIEIFQECNDTFGSINLSLSGGTAPFTTTIIGQNQNLNFAHSNNNLTITLLEFGQHTIITTDSTGQVFQDTFTIYYPAGVELNLLAQIEHHCGDAYPVEYTYPFFSCSVFNETLTMDPTNPNVTFEWFSNGQSLGIYTPSIQFLPCSGGTSDYTELVVVATNTITGCTQSDGVTLKGCWDFSAGAIVYKEGAVNTTNNSSENPYLKAIVYPNPSEKDASFNYKVSSDKVFEGTVEIYNPLGALLQQVPISGQSLYELNFNLQTSGMYFILTRTNGTILTDKIIIK